MRPSRRDGSPADAGVTPALVHYYFSTIDDLFLAVIRRRGAQQAKRQERALSSPRPINALWELSKERAGTGLLNEFIALANHRKAIAAELAEQVAESRQAQLDALQRLVGETDAVDLPPEAMLVLIASVSRTIALEESLGMEAGLAQVAEFVEGLIARRRRSRRIRRSSPTRIRAGRSWPGCATAQPVGGRSAREG